MFLSHIDLSLYFPSSFSKISILQKFSGGDFKKRDRKGSGLDRTESHIKISKGLFSQSSLPTSWLQAWLPPPTWTQNVEVLDGGHFPTQTMGRENELTHLECKLALSFQGALAWEFFAFLDSPPLNPTTSGTLLPLSIWAAEVQQSRMTRLSKTSLKGR